MAEGDKQPGSSDTSSPPTQEPVWSYRGYNLRSSEFTTAMVHYYRYYELWSLRARLIETDFFAAMLVPPFGPHPEWGESLAESLLQPEFPISVWEALGRRFRRNYMWIFVVLAIAWALKGFLHPVPATSWSEFIARSALGPIPGEVVLIIGLLYNGLLFMIGFATVGLLQSSGEVLPKYTGLPILNELLHAMEKPETAASAARHKDVAARPKRHRQQLLALIVTGKPQAIADRVLKEMQRGVTELHGRGMNTQQDREVLMVALTVTEMPHLKALGNAEDINAFVVVTPVQQVLGQGFQPLAADGEAPA
jgi:hypothetical protein